MGEELRWLKEMIRRFLFLSAYSGSNDRPWLCLCPALLSGRALDPGCPALIRSDIWGTAVPQPEPFSWFTLCCPCRWCQAVPAPALSPAASPLRRCHRCARVRSCLQAHLCLSKRVRESRARGSLQGSKGWFRARIVLS